MGVDRAMVTRILNGDQNVTMKTLVTMACALDARLNFELQDLAAVRESTAEAASARLKLAYEGNVFPLRIALPCSGGGPAYYRHQVRDALTATFTNDPTVGATTLTASQLEGERDTTAA